MQAGGVVVCHRVACWGREETGKRSKYSSIKGGLDES